MNKEELESIRLNKKDHNHFTNTCCVCKKSNDDNEMKAILIDRRSGFNLNQHTELDYACHNCLIYKVGYFKSQMK